MAASLTIVLTMLHYQAADACGVSPVEFLQRLYELERDKEIMMELFDLSLLVQVQRYLVTEEEMDKNPDAENIAIDELQTWLGQKLALSLEARLIALDQLYQICMQVCETTTTLGTDSNSALNGVTTLTVRQKHAQSQHLKFLAALETICHPLAGTSDQAEASAMSFDVEKLLSSEFDEIT
jgi:hypothetical protein